MRKILFLLVFLIACSANKDQGVATLSDVNTGAQETEVITEQDLSLIHI